MGQAAEVTTAIPPPPPLAVLAHELRTPLAAIQAYADMMLESPSGPGSEARLREHAAQIRRAAEIGLDVVATLLERHLGVTVATSHAPVSLSSVAASVARIMAPLVDRSGGHIAVHNAAGEACTETVASHVHEILLNLVANALRHAGPAPTIVIRTGAEAGGGNWIEVEDSGLGFTAGAQDGTGLAISRTLAAAAGARLDVLGALPSGARVRLTFAGPAGGA